MLKAWSHAEIFFDPQTHTARGIDLGTVANGISRALKEAEATLGFTSRLILCFLRHLSADDASETLERALRYKHLIAAVDWIRQRPGTRRQNLPPFRARPDSRISDRGARRGRRATCLHL